jgi:hypothetical protein
LSRRHLIIATVAALGLSLLTAAGLWLASWTLERSLREPVNAYLRARTLAFLSEQTVEGLVITFPALDLSLTRRRLLIRDLKIRYDHRDSTHYTRFIATSPLITLNGLDLSDVLWHRHLRLSSIRISNPHLARYQESSDTGRIAPPPAPVPEYDAAAEARALAGQVPSLDSVIYGLVDNWLPDDFREARIDQIAVEGGAVASTSKRGGQISRDSTDGLTLTIRGLGLDSAKHKVFESAELSADAVIHVPRGELDSLEVLGIAFRLDKRDTVLTVQSFRSAPAPGRLGVYLAGFHRSERERSFALDTLALEPVESDSVFLQHPSQRRTRVRLNLAGMLGTDVDLKALLDRRLQGGNIGIARFRLDVLADRRVPAPKREPAHGKTFWPQKLADLDWQLQLDTLRVQHGALRYGEFKAEWPVPAAVWFTEISASITGLSNQRADSTRPSHAVLETTALFMDKASVSLRMEVPVAKRFELTATGQVDHLPAPALNSFLLISDGFRIKSGRIDKATFRFTVADRRALGQFTAIYDSLEAELVDRKTRTQSLGQKLKSFVARAFLVRSSNLPDDKGAVRIAKIDYRYQMGESFWGGFWRALRSGIVSQVKK